MSFFFAKTGKKFQDINVLHQLECKVCPLYTLAANKNKDIKPQGSAKPEVYLLGANTNDLEDKTGKFFADADGRLLRSKFTQFQYTQARINKITRTRDPKGKAQFEAIECCRPSVERDIAETKPAAIFGFGYEVLEWASKGKGPSMEAWRGHHFPIETMGHKCWFFPMYDPEYVLNHMFLDHVFKLDITNAYKFLGRGIKPETENLKALNDGVEILYDLNAIENALN